MNIGLILPERMKNQERRAISRLFHGLRPLIFKSLPIEVRNIEVYQGLHLVLCILPFESFDMLGHEGTRKKLRAKLTRIFEMERAWPVLEHPAIRGVYDCQDYSFDKTIQEVVIERFPEVLKLIRGIGDLSHREVSVTGNSIHLEFAITRLITKVKTLNLLLPQGSQEPEEAEQAFAETGIPVHITTDHEVLNRTALWIRFPDDHESFDTLPENYNGIIVDLGAMKIIDTKNKKIYNIVIEFPDRIKRKIGHSILKELKKGTLEAAIVTAYSNAWDINAAEASDRLGMVLSYES